MKRPSGFVEVTQKAFGMPTAAVLGCLSSYVFPRHGVARRSPNDGKRCGAGLTNQIAALLGWGEQKYVSHRYDLAP